jgi:hypothetical protein
LNEKFNEKLELETIKSSEDMSPLRQEIQTRTQVLNSKFNSLSNVMLEFGTANGGNPLPPQNREMSKILQDRKLEGKVNIQSEIVSLRQEMIVDSLRVMEERLEAKINELVEGRLQQIDSRLDKLSGKVTDVYGNYCQLSADSELNRVHDANGSHVTSIPTSVPPTTSKSQTNCRRDNSNHDDNNEYSVKGRPRTEMNLDASDFTCKNDVVVEDAHFHSSVMGDLTLPKFNN